MGEGVRGVWGLVERDGEGGAGVEGVVGGEVVGRSGSSPFRHFHIGV